jgi:acetyltransferase-like isoleucine patch superfamily enzyme
MSMHNLILQVVNAAIHRTRGSDYQRVDARIPPVALLQVAIYRGVCWFRGLVRRPVLRTRGHLFLGSHTQIRHPQLITAGKGLIIEDHVCIDALSEHGISFGDNVTIARFATIQCTGVVRNLGVGLWVGDNTALGAYSFIGAQGGIRIGRNVIMGPRVNLHAENHVFADPNTPIREQGENRSGIVIDDDCWIGAGAIIVDGVHIGSGSIVAAGSVVTSDIPPMSVCAGVPARVIKSRLG